jgi:hypothetical protein
MKAFVAAGASDTVVTSSWLAAGDARGPVDRGYGGIAAGFVATFR